MCAKKQDLIHDTSHITYESLLAGNKKFIEKAIDGDPDFFSKLANGQKPPILWIGCADSRVPANQKPTPNRVKYLFIATLPIW
ncbi:MAG: hypothetical protein WC615_05870 [Mucilaginibacter sp.]|jgi:carbonic anhydrase|uniref:hypothetical protein n=1 Tax=Mucilaginibacter sp. TaxID=1882438 RepID=UPI003562674F